MYISWNRRGIDEVSWNRRAISLTNSLTSMVFGPNLKILTLAKRIPYERASQKEQNAANFSFIAPSTVE